MTPEGLTALADVERPSNPFPGLRPFEPARPTSSSGATARANSSSCELGRTRFLAVVGTSGSGKSSLVRAGLLPALQGGLMAGAGSSGASRCSGPATTRSAISRARSPRAKSSARTTAERRRCALPHGGDAPAQRPRAARSRAAGARRRGRAWRAHAPQAFREPARRSRPVRGAFPLPTAHRCRDTRSRTPRPSSSSCWKPRPARPKNLRRPDDALGLPRRLLAFLGLPEAINEGQFLIPRMTRDERADAVTGPVAVCGGRIASPRQPAAQRHGRQPRPAPHTSTRADADLGE